MTSSDLQKAKQLPLSLFAFDVSADVHEVGTQSSGFGFYQGIPPSYSSLTGKKVCRADINGLGRLASQAQWFDRLGGYYTFDQKVSDAIGGYPVGAILYCKMQDSGLVRLVRSLIPDNDYNFAEDNSLINGEYWAFVDTVRPTTFRPRMFPDWGSPTKGALNIDEEMNIPVNCLFSIQMGASIDKTDDGSDLFVYLTVKKDGGETYHTAALLAFIPGSAAVITQGIFCTTDYFAPSYYLNLGLHAFNSPSPVQVYLNPGDTVKIVCNRTYDLFESYGYKYYPLMA